MSKWIIWVIVIINIVTFLLYGWDKRCARRKRRRVPEKTLLGFAFFGGSAGALLGMSAFRHKTKHRKFMVCVPLFLALHVIIAMCLLVRSTGC